MSAQDLFEEWERRNREQVLEQAFRQGFEPAFMQGFVLGFEKGFEQGCEQEAKRAISLVYEARFGTMPRAIGDAVEAMHSIDTLESWLVLVATRLQPEIGLVVKLPSRAT